jgi:hypothetical protein
MALESIQLQWGWIFPAVGAVMLLLAGFFSLEPVTRSRIATHVSENRPLWSAGVAGFMALAIVLYFFPPLTTFQSRSETRTAKADRVQAQESKTGWKVSESKSAIDDTVTVFIMLESKRDTAHDLGGGETLVLGCKDRELRVYVYADAFIGSTAGPVRFRFDQRPPISEIWEVSNNGAALFTPTPENMVRQLLGAKTMHFEFTPRSSGRKQVRFEVAGLNKQIARFGRAGCKL